MFRRTCERFIMSKVLKVNKRILRLITLFVRMTTTLMHTVAHSSKHSFKTQTNNHSIKKKLSWVKVVKNCKILTFKVNVYVKNDLNLSIFSPLKNIISRTHFLLLRTSIYFLKWRPIFLTTFTQLIARLTNFLLW